MKQLTILLVTILLLASCTTQNKCMRKYPPEVKTITKDSIVTNITYIRDTLFVTLYDTIRFDAIHDTIYINLDTWTSKVSKLENEFSISKAWVDKILYHELTQKEQIRDISGETEVEVANTDTKSYHSESETKIIKVKYYPTWIIILACIGGGFIIMLITWLVIKIKGGWLTNVSRILK